MSLVRMLFGALLAQQLHGSRREPKQIGVWSTHGEEYDRKCAQRTFQLEWT